MSQLFRQAVLDARKQRLSGDVLLLQPLSTTLCIVLLVGATFLAAVFLTVAEYSRKETVQGYLVPDLGVIQSYARSSGIIETIHVADGDHVEKGTPLVTVHSKSELQDGGDLNARTLQELKQQLEVIEKEIAQQRSLKQKTLAKQQQWLLDLDAEIGAFDERKQLLNQKLDLADQERKQYQKLYEDGHLSIQALRLQQRTHLDLKSQLQSVVADQLALRKTRNTVQSDLTMLPEQHQLRLLEHIKEQSSLRQRYDLALANHRHVLSATQSGTISGLRVTTGESVKRGERLLSIIPEQATLIAELMLPTRSAGFVQTGDKVRLRLEAFPYQRFGYVNGSVSQVDRVLIHPDNAILPLPEPSYRIQVTLAQHAIEQGDQQFALKNGLLLEADIVLESRSILGWILEPIEGLVGKI